MIGRVLGLGLRTYVRYAGVLTLVSFVVLGPLLLFVARVPVPANNAQAGAVITSLAKVSVIGVVWTLVLVGAVAPLARSVAARTPLGQGRALGASIRGLLTSALPVLAALIAIGVGLAALVAPGLVLLPLVAYVGATTAPGIAARIHESATIARAHLVSAIALLAVVGVVITALALAMYVTLPVPLPKRAPPALLAEFPVALRRLGLGLAGVTPLLASLLAALPAAFPALEASADPAEIDG